MWGETYHGYRNNLDDTDYETPVFQHSKAVSTRKPHTCDVCGEVIPAHTMCIKYVVKMPYEDIEYGYRHIGGYYEGECFKG